MSKKKKINTAALQKQQQAQGRSEFKRRINSICMLMPDGEKKVKLIEKHIDIMYRIRPYPIKISLIGDKDPLNFMDEAKENYDFITKNEMTPMYEGGPEVSLIDYHQLVRPLQRISQIMGEKNSNIATHFEQFLKNADKNYINVVEILSQKAEVMGLIGSNFIEGFYQVALIVPDPDEVKSPREALRIETTYKAPTWKQIKLGAQKRIAARVGWSFSNVILWMEIRPSQLGIKKYAGNDTPMEVYMMKHAVNRLYERIGINYPEMMNTDIFVSLFNTTTIHTGGGNFLIEYSTKNHRVGYFAATVTDGVLLIRTFLFLTHSGTPEGKKLVALTGLEKHDQMHLAFGSLTALTNSDILTNEHTRKIFCEAGCEDMLELCSKMRQSPDFWNIDVSDTLNPIAEKMLQYIKSGKEEISDLWESIQDDKPEAC